MQAGRTAEAAEQFRTLLVASPDVVPARLGLASLLLLQGRWQQAKVEYEVALRHGDTDGLAQGRLGYIVLHHEADPGGALNYYNEGVAVAGAAAKHETINQPARVEIRVRRRRGVTSEWHTMEVSGHLRKVGAAAVGCGGGTIHYVGCLEPMP